MESSELLKAVMMEARATHTELTVRRKAKEDELKAFLNYNGEIIEKHHRIIKELEEATRAVSKHLVRHPYL